MIICVNAELNYTIEDDDHCEITYDEYIFTAHGIFKKYKFHFFECIVDEEVQTYLVDGLEFLTQKSQPILNKTKIITSIPYHNYHVKRKTIKSCLNEYLTLVKEIDNDTFTRHYFILTKGTIYDGFNHISSFLNKKV